MMVPDTSTRGRRALQLAIIGAFFAPGSAARIAQAFSSGDTRLRAADVRKIWADAKARGDLPRLTRPHGGVKAKERKRA